MDINFKCSHCQQELTADGSGAGSQIECPSCGHPLVIPAQAAASGPAPTESPANPIMSSASAREDKHYAVPQHDKKAEAPTIEKPNRPLEVTAKETDKKMRVRSIRRSDCVEVGKDHFDERVTEFLNKVGEPNIISVTTFNYTHQDLATRQFVEDFGVLILYRG